MSQMSSLEQEVAVLITQSLNLETDPGAIDPAQPLYREGLGLDSIDLLDLSLVISKTYGFQIKFDDPEKARIFSSLGELTRTIEIRRTK
jgi:acyl carrier protein